MIHIDHKTDCCGCTACASICSSNAINMLPDEMGFLCPSIEANKCVDCGLCDRVCQFNSNYNRYDNYKTPFAFSFRLKDENQLKRSQSGGAFIAIASQIIGKGGIVYGAAFTSTWRVTHQKAFSFDELEKLRMSKYVQSDLRGVFPLVKKDLQNGKLVLFSGTACQVAGLKSYLPKRLHENLLCVDIICHGVPSPKIWEDYITYLEEKYQSKIVNACFRDKRFGWHGAIESFLFSNGKEVFRKTNNKLYFTGLSTRESCSQCHYTNLKRVGDITIGDFWCIPKETLFSKDEKGVSVVFANSENGSKYVEMIKDVAIIEEYPVDACMQPQLERPSSQNPLHDQFVADYVNCGFKQTASRYNALGSRYYIDEWKQNIRSLVGNILRFIKLRKTI